MTFSHPFWFVDGMSWEYLILLLALLAFFGLRSRGQTSLQKPDFTIVVDGSNVMHWAGDPSAVVLKRVLQSLENMGHKPVVFFDASVGYRLGDRYHNEAMLAEMLEMSSAHICVVDKGVVADEAILMFASDHNLRIVTNDQFRDWRVQFPIAARKGQLLRGTWREGAVVWRGKL